MPRFKFASPWASGGHLLRPIRAASCWTGQSLQCVWTLLGFPELSGEITTEEGPSPVNGAQYWLSGAEGVASQFSGDAGCKRLSVYVRALIPRPAEG